MNQRVAANRRTTNSRQRKKQQHLLDVKIRVTTERRRRMRAIFAFTCKFILFTTLAVGSWLGGKEALRRFLWENPDYFIRDVKVSTDGTLTRDQVLRAGGIVEGTNIFRLNLSQARAAIEKLPQVENAEVTRSLPNRLTVSVAERRPIAWIASRADEDPTASDRSFLVDARGMVMRTKVRLEEYLNFPVISGLATANLVPGERVTSVEMQAALELIRRTSEDTRFQPRHIDVSKGYCIVATDHKRAKITFGLDGIDQQLVRLHRFYARAAEDFRELQTVNLIVERNTPVTFVEPPEPEPEPAEEAAPVAAPASRAKAATTAPRALPASTPAKAATPSSSKTTPRKTSSGVKKKPFRLNP